MDAFTSKTGEKREKRKEGHEHEGIDILQELPGVVI
jgi:hypothetical protein